MADITRDTRQADEQERQAQKQHHQILSAVSQRLATLTKLLDEYNDFESNSMSNLDFTLPLTTSNSKNRQSHLANKPSSSLPLLDTTQVRHLSRILANGHTESIIGTRRLAFRSHLDAATEIAFHCTLRMLRELLERMLLRHGPRLWHRDTRDKYSVTLWFLLNQGPRSLARLFLPAKEGEECCHHMSSGSRPKCHLSNPLDDYWNAWSEINTPLESGDLRTSAGAAQDGLKHMDMNMGMGLVMGLGMGIAPSPTRLTLSWSVKPALFDTRGRKSNRAAERYLKEMWGKRHVGLHEAFTVNLFSNIL
ncbi:uncharacterized protein BDV17DRAFT_54236 [Aspergillus undulatus]|uniref:uncharacterized protein n=1 Tax=Aspergillus undulatus TaxID=1810928 RepID=UPI003CCDE519